MLPLPNYGLKFYSELQTCNNSHTYIAPCMASESEARNASIIVLWCRKSWRQWHPVS